MSLLNVLSLYHIKYYLIKLIFINKNITINNIFIINDLYNVQINVNKNDKNYDYIFRLIIDD